MTVRTVTMMMCDACLYGRGACSEPACIGSAKRMADPIHNPALVLINGFAMCCECDAKRAEHVTDPGTEDERHYCGTCFRSSGTAQLRGTGRPALATEVGPSDSGGECLMARWLYIAALLLAASSAQAQEDWERDLQPATLVGDGDPTPAVVNRPQLVHHTDWKTPTGTVAAVAGAGLLVTSWAFYVARQNYRLRPWLKVDEGTMQSWQTMGAATFWLGAGGSAALVASEYLLIPEERSTPFLAWTAGAVGLGVAAVGIGFAVGGTHCAPQALTPGANIYADCLRGTSDSLFGIQLLLTSAPLLNVPLVFLFRKAFAGAPESLSFGPGTVQVTGRF